MAFARSSEGQLGLDIDPFAQRGLDEAFGLAVGLWRKGSGSDMAQARSGVFRSSGSSTIRRARTTESRVNSRGFVAAFTSDKRLDRSRTSLRQFPPSRIVCLTGETVETLYLLDEQDLIVGVSGYAVRPPQVRREKPRVSAVTSADIPKILALEPDLVLTFSDLQAPIAAELIRAGVAVHAFNQRDIAGILAIIRTVGALVGAVDKSEELARRV